jgi:PhnB protein
MSQVTPYLTVYNAMDAIDFYKEVFHAEVHGEIDMLSNYDGYKELTDKVAHCALKIFDTLIFIGDNIEKEPLAVGDHIQMVVQFEDEEHLKKAYDTLSKEGHVFSELAEVPWGKIGATVRDSFHVTWMMFVDD